MGRLTPRAVFERVVDCRAGEAAAVLLAAAQFFCLLFGCFMLRPLRETMGLRSGVDSVRLLFLVTVGAMVVGNVVYGWVASRVSRRALVPGVYGAIVVTLGGFLVAMLVIPDADREPLGKVFYVWFSVVNLFAVSVFWQLLADVFTLEQSKRLFGFIGVGGTAGAMLGSSYAWQLADDLGPFGLMVSASVLFVSAGVVASVLSGRAGLRNGLREVAARDGESHGLGGKAWAGLSRLFESPYLGGIGLMVLLFTVTSTLLYFEKLRIVEAVIADDDARTALFAKIEVAGQTLTVLLQLFLTGRLMRWLGVGVLLAVVPLISIVGFATLGLVPTLAVLTVFEATRRAGNFALSKPARETLFTVVPRADKYKAKAGIDTFVYRGGDTVGTGVDMGLAWLGVHVASAAIPIGVVALWIAGWLGIRQKRLAGIAPGGAANRMNGDDVGVSAQQPPLGGEHERE